MKPNRNLRYAVFAGLSSLALALTFQNCGKGFKVNSELESLEVLSAQAPHGKIPQVIIENGSVLESESSMSFSVFSENLSSNTSITWSHTFNGLTNGCVIESTSNSLKYTVLCEEAGDLVVDAQVKEGSAQAQPALSYKSKIIDIHGDSPSDEMKVRFTVAPGTGSNPWNSMSNKIETFIGQTLIIENKDSIAHQLHTNGSPFGHGTQFAAGAIFTAMIQSEYNPSSNSVYDHDVGNTALFYIEAHSGKKLYDNNCKSCHESPGTAPRLSASSSSVTHIRSNINKMGSPMSANQNLKRLTTRQIEAISNYLGSYGVIAN